MTFLQFKGGETAMMQALYKNATPTAQQSSPVDVCWEANAACLLSHFRGLQQEALFMLMLKGVHHEP